jgi:hypothetical protein
MKSELLNCAVPSFAWLLKALGKKQSRDRKTTQQEVFFLRHEMDSVLLWHTLSLRGRKRKLIFSYIN